MNRINCKLDVLPSRQSLSPVPRDHLHLNTEQITDEFVCNDDPFDIEEKADVDNTVEQNANIICNQVIDKTIHDQTQQHMNRHKLTVGFHLGQLNPLPLTWKYPCMNMIHMITMYPTGSKAEGVVALRVLNSTQVNHFNKEVSNLSRMQHLMNLVKH